MSGDHFSAGPVRRRTPRGARVGRRGRDAYARRDLRRPGGLPSILFALYVVAALPILIFGLGRDRWFSGDEWYFLAGRDASSLDDLFRPHNQHWSTLPILVFRGLFRTVGLRSYAPYLLFVVAAHLGVCALLWLIMRRAGVGAWLAAAAAGTFVLFGPGSANILTAFQIGFTGALLLGLVQLVLADHDGGWDRRDWLGLAAGGTALLMSGVTVSTAVIVGLAMLAKRGWKVAFLHTAPIGAVFLVWLQVEHPPTTAPSGRPPLGDVVDWVRSGEIGTFLALGHFQAVAAILAVVLLVGMGLAFLRVPPARSHPAIIPLALLAGAVVFQVITAQGRAWAGSGDARASRYVYLDAALTLPALAVAAEAIARRWRVALPVLVVVVALAAPWNIDLFRNPIGPAADTHVKVVLTNVTRMPEARIVPRDVRPYPSTFGSPDLTIGFLRDAVAAGRLPVATAPIPADLQEELRIRLGVAQRRRAAPTTCRPVSGPLELDPPKGTIYGFRGKVLVAARTGRQPSAPVQYSSGAGEQLTVDLPRLRLRLTPVGPFRAFTFCT